MKAEATLAVPAKLRRAFWRLALNRNPYWFWYTKKSKVTLGRLAATGNDFTAYAGLPYHIKAGTVDEYQLGFGFYSRNDRGDCRWAGYDLEPLQDRHKIENPTAEQLASARGDARRLYAAWLALADSEPALLWTLLVRSSPGRYHVWTIFEQPISQKEHDRLHKLALKLTGPLVNLDASSFKSRRGLGCGLRAPWTFKEGQQSEAVRMWLRDEPLAMELAEQAVPMPQPNDPLEALAQLMALGPKPVGPPASRQPSTQHWKLRSQEGPTRTLLEELFHECKRRYPIKGLGQRDRLTLDAVRFLFNCGLREGDLTRVALKWVAYFQSVYTATLAEAMAAVHRAVTNTYWALQSGKLLPYQAQFDYDNYFRTATLTSVEQRLVQRACLTVTGPRREENADEDTLSSPIRIGDDNTTRRTDRKVSGAVDIFLECLVLQARLKLTTREEAESKVVDWTNRQMIAAIAARSGRILDSTEIHRLKRKFVSFLGKDDTWHNATALELLREVRKGFRDGDRPGGVPSLYEPSPELLAAIDHRECKSKQH